jgi:hypothetical protein
VIVICIWTALLGVALRVYLLGSNDGIPALGQLGDTFGSLNALFTGLTLIGLVLTAFLQRSQLAAQREEIDAQKKASDLDRKALAKQSRAEFLSARLQAETAILDAEREIWQQHDVPTNRFEQSARSRSLNRRLMAIQLLRFESQQGFDEAPWSLSIQKEAIRRLLVETTQTNVNTFARLEALLQAPYAKGLMTSRTDTMQSQIDLLLEDYGFDHPNLHGTVRPLREALAKYENDPETAVAELRKALTLYLAKDSPFWM